MGRLIPPEPPLAVAPPTTVSPGRFGLALGGIVVVALALRLVVWNAIAPTELFGDEVFYENISARLADGSPIRDITQRAPGLPFYYAAFHRIFGTSLASARLGSVFAGTLTVALIALLARRFAGPAAGVVAGVAAALYPNLVFFSSSLLTESVYVTLVTGVLLALAGGGFRPGARALVVAGVLTGLATLCREIGTFLAVAVALWILVSAPRPRGALRPVSTFLAAFLVTILPWTIHLNRTGENFALVSRTSWLTLYVGNHDSAPGERGGFMSEAQSIYRGFREYGELGSTPVEREAAAREAVLSTIRDDLPAWPFRKLAVSIPALFTPNSQPVARLLAHPDDEGSAGKRAYRFRGDALGSPPARAFVAGTAIGAWVGLLLLGSAGLALGRGPGSRLFLAFAVAHVVPTVIAFALTRHRLPILPVLFVGAAALVVSGRGLWAEAGRGRRVGAVATVVAFATILATRIGDILSARWG